MLTVHHLRSSQSERIVWLCEELGIDYELKLYNRGDHGIAPPEYKALHPVQAAPVITDGDLHLAESGAIIEYICGKYGDWRLTPKADDKNFAQHLFWFHYANGTFMTCYMIQIGITVTGGNAEGSFAEDRLMRGWKMLDEQLGKTPFIGGNELTTADIMMGYILTTRREIFPQAIDNWPNVKAYLARIGDREAYRRARAKAEPGVAPMLT